MLIFAFRIIIKINDYNALFNLNRAMKALLTTFLFFLFCMPISLFGQIKQQPTQQELNEKRDSSLPDGKNQFENPHSIHNFVSSTGIGLRKGEGYYNNIYLVSNTGAYGFTKHFSLGLSIIPRFAFLAIPKLSFQVRKNFSLGLCGVVGRLDGGPVVAGYGVATFGNRDNNLSVGMGSGVSTEYSLDSPIFFSINGQIRVARKVSLITENYILQGHILGVSGFRFMNAKAAFNLGVIYPNVIGFGPITPFLGFGIPFKSKK